MSDNPVFPFEILALLAYPVSQLTALFSNHSYCPPHASSTLA